MFCFGQFKFAIVTSGSTVEHNNW